MDWFEQRTLYYLGGKYSLFRREKEKKTKEGLFLGAFTRRNRGVNED
jgi:hypothetical protein